MQFNFVDVVGTAAAIFTTISFIPQVIQVVKTKSTKDISLLMFSLFTLGVTFWLIYGFLTDSLPIILANATVLCLSLTIIGYKLKYK